MTVTRDPDAALAGVKLTVITKSARSLRSATDAPFWISAGLSTWRTCWTSSADGGLSPTGLIAMATAGRRACVGLVQLVTTNVAESESKTVRTNDTRFMCFAQRQR